jgi:hypothetical protein
MTTPQAPQPHHTYTQLPPAQTWTPNANALGSFFAGFFWLFGVGSLIAVILGHAARREIRERNQDGGALAMTGLILGYIGLAGLVLFIILMASAASSEPSIYDY